MEEKYETGSHCCFLQLVFVSWLNMVYTEQIFLTFKILLFFFINFTNKMDDVETAITSLGYT